MTILDDPTVQKGLLWVIGSLSGLVAILVGVILKHIVSDIHSKDGLDSRVVTLEVEFKNVKEDLEEIKDMLEKLLERR